MTIVNTGVNYPIERGATGKFKALESKTTITHTLSAANPLTIAPAKGNAILLFGLSPVGSVTNTSSVTVSGSLYGSIVINSKLDVSNTPNAFYISVGGAISAGVAANLNCSPPIQFETDEIVTVTNVGATIDIYYSHQEGYLL